MELLLCILSILRNLASTFPIAGQNRTKLQKKRRDRKNINKICSREMLDAIRKSSIGLCLPSQEAIGLMTERLTSTEPHLQHLISHCPSTISNASGSFYSIDQMQQQNMRRTRPKTPIHRVGQREDLTTQSCGIALKLAEGYQAVLPLRERCEHYIPEQQPLRRLRKVKFQTSLRDLSRIQGEERAKTPMTDSDGDVDTLIGSEPTSPDSKIQDEFWRVPSTRKPNYSSVKSSKGDIDKGLQVCVDLLTNELASVLFRHHPVEESDRASELQILLMIEAYETIQKQIHERRMNSHTTLTICHVSQLEQLLENWLDVLYDLYERSKQSKDEEPEYVEIDYSLSSSKSMNDNRTGIHA